MLWLTAWLTTHVLKLATSSLQAWSSLLHMVWRLLYIEPEGIDQLALDCASMTDHAQVWRQCIMVVIKKCNNCHKSMYPPPYGHCPVLYAWFTQSWMPSRINMWVRLFVSPNTLMTSITLSNGNVNSVDWNDGMERWSGLLECHAHYIA